jgi:hypothetical protein
LQSWRSNNGRVGRIEQATGRLAQQHHAAATARETRRQELEFFAGIAEWVRDFAAPEDAGPGVARALDMGDAAVAELGYVPVRTAPTQAELAALPDQPPPAWLDLWRKLGHLWEMREPGRPPQTVAEAYAYAIARCCGGRFPHYPED